MKNFQVLLVATVCGILFGAMVTASAQSGSVGFATVVRVDGGVSYSLGDDKWSPLVGGKILPVGATVRTDHNGSADIVLGKDINLPQQGWQSRWTPEQIAPAADATVRGTLSYRPSAEQNVVRLTPNTTLGINKLTVIDTGADSVSDTELDLKQGKIFASVKKLNGPSQYLIKLPNGIAGVRGTQFSIDVNGVTQVYHSSGGGVVLSLVPLSGIPQTTIVGAGFSFDPSTGQLTILPGDAQTFMDRIFSAIQTIYSPVEFVVRKDSTYIYISPTHGGSGTVITVTPGNGGNPHPPRT